MCKTWGRIWRIRIRVGIKMVSWIRMRIGIKTVSQIQIRIGIKTTPIHNTTNYDIKISWYRISVPVWWREFGRPSCLRVPRCPLPPGRRPAPARLSWAGWPHCRWIRLRKKEKKLWGLHQKTNTGNERLIRSPNGIWHTMILRNPK